VYLGLSPQREKLIKQFEEGTVCPTCNRALDEVDHTDEIKKIKKEYYEKSLY
jgi:transcription initiation factor IIE alpha subunit